MQKALQPKSGFTENVFKRIKTWSGKLKCIITARLSGATKNNTNSFHLLHIVAQMTVKYTSSTERSALFFLFSVLFYTASSQVFLKQKSKFMVYYDIER